MTPRKPILLLGGIVLLALLLRLMIVWPHPETERDGRGTFRDSSLYARIAANLALGHGFTGTPLDVMESQPGWIPEPAVTRGPVYPAFLAAVLKLTSAPEELRRPGAGPSVWHRVRIAQTLLDALTCVPIFLMTRRIVRGSGTPALIAAALYALCPYALYYVGAILKETINISLSAWAIYLSVRALETRRSVEIAAAGVGWGMCALCTPQLLAFPVFIAGAALAAAPRRWRRTSLECATLLAAVAITIAPWTLRNALTFERFIPVSVGSLGGMLYLGTFETDKNWRGFFKYGSGIFTSPEEKETFYEALDRFRFYTTLGSIRVEEPDRVFYRLAVERLRRDPLGCISNWFRRLPRLWYQTRLQMYRDPEPPRFYFAFYLVFAAVAGGLATSGQRRRMLPPIAVFCFLSLLYLPMHVEPRYGLPALPGILALCGIGLTGASRRLLDALPQRS